MSVPVFLDTNTDAGHLLRQWVRLYHYGNIYNACHMRDHLRDLCVHGTGQPWVLIRYALAAATPLAMVPFTWLVMAPTNNALFGLEASSASGSEGGSIRFRAGAGGALGVVTHGSLCVPCGRRDSGLDGNPAGSRCIGAFAALGASPVLAAALSRVDYADL